MKKLLFLVALCPLLAVGQQYNNFEISENLDILIDTTLDNNIWQIGPPQKLLFNNTLTPPNALMTDTINNYPENNYSTCQFEVDLSVMEGYPFIVIVWRQKVHTDFGKDGGWIEASYDGGITWVNIFMDTNIQPLVVGSNQISTLDDGTFAFTGSENDWNEIMVCWENGAGSPPFPLSDNMGIRFVFRSDSIPSNHEGWMMDDLQIYPTFIDFVSESKNDNKIDLTIYPNPASEDINIELELNQDCQLSIDILDIQGRLLKRVIDSRETKGIKQYRTALTDLGAVNEFLLVRCNINGNFITQKLIVTR
jgi:hypothetical protein